MDFFITCGKYQNLMYWHICCVAHGKHLTEVLPIRGVDILCLTCPTWFQFIQDKLEISVYLSLDKYKESTVKPVLSDHSKIDKTKVLMTNGSLMKVESIAECSHWSILQYF